MGTMQTETASSSAWWGSSALLGACYYVVYREGVRMRCLARVLCLACLRSWGLLLLQASMQGFPPLGCPCDLP